MDGTSDQAASNWGNVYVPGDPNNAPLATSNFDPGHRFNLTATYKPCVDGLVDAHVVVDDDDLHVQRDWPEIRPVDPARAGLILTVEPLIR